MRIKRVGERLAMTVMTAGILMVWQPWERVLFQWGFLVTIAGTLFFIIASHLPDR